MKLTGLPGDGLLIHFDHETCILRDEHDEYNIYDFSNYEFLEFASGDNNLILDGIGEVTISGRCMYNVGA